MLILPVHHRLERKNVPWMTLLIALLCIFIFFGPQQGDVVIEERAVAFYTGADLLDVERPLYEAYAAAHPEALVHGFSEDSEGRDDYRDEVMPWDRGFRRSLEAGDGFANADAARDWMEKSRPFRDAIASTVYERFTMKSDSPTTFQAFTSDYLHADWDHLIGNLLFLLMLGLLVERALGPWLFLGLYVLSGLGASWVWAMTAGPNASSLGASGAISGLMGALCVLWGMRRIRFFYWFFVFFDYVRAPAIWMLVPWLGWELLQWATNDGGTVAYSAHAGGIAAGAGLAAVIRWRAWDRPEAYADTVDAMDQPEHRVIAARAALGRLAFDEVESILAPLLEQTDAPFEAQLLGLRAAVTARRTALAQTRARALLAAPAGGNENDQRLNTLAAWRQSGGQWSSTEALTHARLLAARARCDESAGVLMQATQSGALPNDWAGDWLRLAFDCQRDGDAAGAARLFTALAEALPDSPEAAKARALA